MSLWLVIAITVLSFILIIVGYLIVSRFISSRQKTGMNQGSEVKLEGGSRKKRSPAGPLSHSSGRADAAAREKALTAVFGALLGVLLIRLFQLQVTMSGTFRRNAEENMTSTVSTTASRGRILDCKGNVLVDNRGSLSVVGTKDVIDNRALVHRLALVLGLPKGVVRNRLMDSSLASQASRTIAYDVSLRSVAYIQEHASAFPGVSVESRTVRSYPNGTMAAHVLGYTGTISEDELQEAKVSGNIEYESNDEVGKTGAEAAYESVLQGERGSRVYQVDANGNATDLLSTTDSHAGSDIRLTIDKDVQSAAEKFLAQGLVNARNGDGSYPATAGSMIVLDLKTGGIVAMANNPTYDPAEFIGGISDERWAQLMDEDSDYPMTNRAIAGQYPAASTFKSFSGLAGLKYEVITEKSSVECTGTWTGFGEDYPQHCWQLTGHGPVDFYEAYPLSCDAFFYEEAKGFYLRDDVDDEPLMDTYKGYGFGSVTGIDIPGEAEGRVPTPEWKKEYYADAPQNAAWQPGDYSNIIIGQGDILVTPLQLVVAYGAIATGKRIKPHLLQDVLNEQGEPSVTRELEYQDDQPDMPKDCLEKVRDALKLTAQRYGLADGLGMQLAAKTGTGETGRADREDYAVFACYAPFDDPQYAISVFVEQGGSGSLTALPIASEMLAYLFGREAVTTTGDANER